MGFDLVIAHDTLVAAPGQFHADTEARGDRGVAIGGNLRDAARVLSAAGCCVLRQVNHIDRHTRVAYGRPLQKSDQNQKERKGRSL